MNRGKRARLRRWAVVLCVGLAGLTAVAASAQRAPEPGAAPEEAPRRLAVRFLTDSDYPPFQYYDEDGVLTGFNVDVARAVCQELAAVCDVQARPWDELIPALRRGEADAVIAAHAITPGLLGEVEVTDRYFYMAARFAARRAAKIEATPEGLDGKRIGVAKGTAHETYLRTFFQFSTVEAFETHEAAREALMAGRVDAVFDDGVSLSFWVNGTLAKDCCELKGGPYYEPKFFGDGLAVIVAKQDVQLKAQVNAALKHIRESGRLEELALRYFPVRVY